jgi:hypothetical protein
MDKMAACFSVYFICIESQVRSKNETYEMDVKYLSYKIWGLDFGLQLCMLDMKLYNGTMKKKNWI